MIAAAVFPLKIPSISRSQADLLNRLAAWRVPLPIPGYEMFTLLRVERSEAEFNLAASKFLIEFSFGRDRFTASMPHGLTLNLLGSLEPGLKLEPFPPVDLAGVLLESVLLPLLERLERCTSRPIKILSVVPQSEPNRLITSNLTSANSPIADTDGDGSAKSSTICLELRGNGLLESLTLSGPMGALDVLLSCWPIGSRALASLTLPVSLQAGTTTLSRKLVRSLGVGDAVLFQHDYVKTTRNGHLPSVLRMVIAGVSTTTVFRIDGGWRLEAMPQKQWHSDESSIDMTEIGSDKPASMPGDLDDLPIRLLFEAGNMEISLGELRRLGAGSLIQSDSVPGIVRILANGRLLGTGELVTIDGRTGVRITAFSPGIDTLRGQEAAG